MIQLLPALAKLIDLLKNTIPLLLIIFRQEILFSLKRLMEIVFKVYLYIKTFLNPYFKLISATNGVDGEKLAINKVPDLIVSDVMMPKRSGFDLASRLKNNPITSHIPIVLLTAKIEQKQKIKGLKLGIDDYITKPFHTEELYLRIHNLIDKRQKLQKHYSNTVIVEPTKLEINSVDEVFLKDLMHRIESNIENGKLTVEQLSENLHMSKKQLERKLRALLNKSPNQLIREFRLERAKQLLANNAGSISQIAYQTGYSSVSYFTKSFKEHFNQTPSEYTNKQ